MWYPQPDSDDEREPLVKTSELYKEPKKIVANVDKYIEKWTLIHKPPPPKPKVIHKIPCKHVHNVKAKNIIEAHDKHCHDH